jgi:hypothetical protein
MTTEATQNEASQQQEEEVVDMDALFAEAAGDTPAAAEEGAETPTEKPEQEEKTESPAIGENDLDLSQNSVKKEATPAAASPEKPVVKEEKPAADWRTALSPEAKAEMDKLDAERNRLLHQARSDAGRVAALTKRLDEASRRAKLVDNAEAQSRAALFKKFEADYPEIAAAMRAQHEEQQAQIESTKRIAEELAKDKVEEARLKREAAVEAAHAGWKQIVSSPAFEQWLGAQPQGVQALGASDEPGDAIALLDRFHATHPATSSEAGVTKTTATTTTASKPSKTAAEIKAERAKQLEASQGVATKETSRESTNAGAADDVELAFDHYAKKAESKRR